MIEKIYKNKYMVICDNCGDGYECDSWADAMEFMLEEGWKKKLLLWGMETLLPGMSGKRGRTRCLKRYWSWRCRRVVGNVHSYRDENYFLAGVDITENIVQVLLMIADD